MTWIVVMAALWIAMGIFSLVVYLRTWTDKPPLWFWPIIVLLWPLVWTGGIIHPLH
jgi:hypothetical protein